MRTPRIISSALVPLMSVMAMSGLSASVCAETFQLDFTFSDFFDATGGDAIPPADPVNGEFVFTAASYGGKIESLLSADVDVGDHDYRSRQVGFKNAQFGNPEEIEFGARANGVGRLTTGTNDFSIIFKGASGHYNSAYMLYSVVGNGTYWQSDTVDFTLTQLADGPTAFSAPVPEPSDVVLMLVGLGVMGIEARRRRRIGEIS